MEQEEMQQVYMQFQMLSQQQQAMQEHLEKLGESMLELQSTAQCLDELSKTQEGTETLVPMSSGIFLKTKLDKNSEVLVNVGASTVVSKSIKDSLDLVKKQEIELLKYKDQLESQISEIQNQLQALQSKVENV